MRSNHNLGIKLQILDRIRHRPLDRRNRIRNADRNRLRPRIWEPAGTRLQPVDPRERRGETDGTANVGADAEERAASGDEGAFAAGGAARGDEGVVGVEDFSPDRVVAVKEKWV